MIENEFFELVKLERKQQNEKWGFPQDLNLMEWGSVIAEETGELCQTLNDTHCNIKNGGYTLQNQSDLIDEAVQVAAVALNILEHLPYTTRNEE